MATQHIADISIEDLYTIIDERIRRQLHLQETRSVKEINESIRRNRWTPPEGSPSNLELLREDRER